MRINFDSLREDFARSFPKEETGGFICTINGDLDPSCVWDKHDPDNCAEASKGTKKEDCPYWVLYTHEAYYNGKELHEWMERYLAT